jgi:hypothetical protein
LTSTSNVKVPSAAVSSETIDTSPVWGGSISPDASSASSD